MKKMKILLATLALIVGGYNAFAGTKTVYLKPGSWNTASAWYALYAFKVDGNTWSVFSEINGSGIYKATFDDSYTAYNLVRLRPSTADGYKSDNDGMNWDNKWGQTSDLTETGIVYEMTNADYSASTYTTASLVSLSDASLSNGKYLFKNVATGKYMGPANSWGTRASLIDPTYYNTVETVPEGGYKIESQVSNGGTSYYLGLSGGNLFMDNGGANIRIQQNGEGVYCLSVTDGVSFIGYDGSNTTLVWNLTDPSSTAAQWQIIPYATAVSDLSNGTLASPKDATFLVKSANFDRNDRSYSSWVCDFQDPNNYASYNHWGRAKKEDADNEENTKNWLIGTWSENGRRIKVSQNLTELPSGIYKITCQGFYRDGASDGRGVERNAYLYANNQSSPIMNIDEGSSVPSNEADASTAFSNGDFSNNEVYAYVSDGNLEIGIRKEKVKGDNWLCFDNFRLFYCGTLASAAASASASTPVNMTYLVSNPKASFDLSDWTTSSTIRNDARGFDAAPGFFEVADWNASSWNSSMTQTVTSLPTGIYRVRAVGQQSTDNTTLEMVINSGTPTSFDHNGDTNGTINIAGEEVSEGSGYQGWRYKTSPDVYIDNGNLEIKFRSTGSAEHKWANIDNVELYYLGNPYPALAEAIGDAGGYVLGFDDGEYAPYENVAVLEALAAARTINTAKTATAAEVEAATTALTGATWTANVGEKDAVYNGNMALTDGSNPKGWLREGNPWGMQVNSSDNNYDYSITSNNTAWYYNNGGTPCSSYYGNNGVYTMPLKGSTTYLLRVKYCSQGDNGYGVVSSYLATIKKGNAAVLNAHEFGGNSTKKFIEKNIAFTTDEAGDYVLELNNTGNIYFTDVSIKKLITIDETVAYTPEAKTTHVVLNRTIKANTWNTFCVPFAISNAELTAAFGADVAVAEYFETAEGNSSTVDFETMDTPAIAANTPVLLKTSTAGTSYTFTGRTIVDATPVKAGTNFDFVGTYAPTTYVKTGDYYISANTLYRSLQDNGTYINGTRAYLHDKSSATARIAKFIIDGVEASGIDGIEMGVNSQNGKIYNLNGQEVKNAQKGLYIQNGKKVIVK